MKNDELGPGYLHAEDLLADGQWKQYTLTVEKVNPPNTIKSADGKPINKPVIEFAETEKKLVLNGVNQRLMKCALGTGKVTAWVGKKVTLHAALGNWFGQTNVAAVRVRVNEGRARPFLKAEHFGKDLTGQQQYKE